MREMLRVAVLVALMASAGVAGYAVGARRSPATPMAAASSRMDDADLRRMYEEDQSDRSSGSTDWAVVEPRDRARREQVRRHLAEGKLATGNDYYHAAMVLQHGDHPHDFLLAHDLAVAAAIMGQAHARWLAAASEDRFLRRVGQPQRFGTQFRKDGDGPWYLENVDATVPHSLRRVMDVPAIAESAARVVELNKAK